ncbi:MAG: FAD-dependent oxidoreductase [Enterocloster asparagiformis]|nr:FAD-dependent oxidoreductase [Enterocloster asparagiformis]
MIRINQLKMPLGHSEEGLRAKAAKALRIREGRIAKLNIVKQSVDARKKPEINYSYVVDVAVGGLDGAGEQQLVHRLRDRNVTVSQEKAYRCPQCGEERLDHPPVVVGTGPAGLFCGLLLAKKGYRPILLERGQDVDARTRQVAAFWEGRGLNPDSNVQFGEGGAGTFSDGKLNTLVKDASGRNREVLRILVEFGADPSILYVNKPHIGTDVLSLVVKAIRREIINLGGQVHFMSQVTDVELKDGHLSALIVGGARRIPAEAAVLAIGHSARDTFEMLCRRGIPMEAKAFAVGLRIQHPQSMINLSQYGREQVGELGAASYKVTWKASSGRGVYSFCMCPGGYVVDASSEPGRLAVNGMSYHGRAGENANSALIVTVTPEDFPDATPLGGMHFQRQLEERAFALGGGKIPVQLYGDFKDNRKSSPGFGGVQPQFKGGYAFCNLRQLWPEELSGALIEGVEAFEGMIRGFSRPDAILAGIESRTSSPVRIPRDQGLQSSVGGIYPCGEGAGYAGGITSAAMDGLKTAEEIIRRFALPQIVDEA